MRIFNPENKFSNFTQQLEPVLKSHKTLDKDFITSLSYKLDFAVSSPKMSFAPHAFYGKDMVIGYDALRLMIGYEGNQTGAHLVSADDDQFVGVRLLVFLFLFSLFYIHI